MKNCYIGLMADDSPGLLLGVLAILKSGNCFVPINPLYPRDRIRFIIEDCRIKILLVDKVNYEKAKEIINASPTVRHLICIDDICIDDMAEAGNKGVLNGLKCDEGARALYCYVIYTSGSTGRPKGVPITHRNLLPLFYYSREHLGLGAGTRVLQNLSYTFDFGVFEILTTFLFGGCFFILNKSIKSDFYYYPHFINSRQINTLHTTPVFLNNLADTGQKMYSIKLLHLGGEQLTGEVVKKALQVSSPGCHLYNGYGPTEATINCTFFFLNKEKIAANLPQNVPIGRPCDLHNIYILDQHANPQPVGVAGELCIAGPGLAHGYLNCPDLTNQKFLEVQEPFFKKVPGPRREKFYRTGDLARWLPDGNMEFLGRIDQQVKIRGFRIELGEIESCLSLFPAVKETVVLARKHDNGVNYLCAYIVSETKEPPAVSTLREFLLKHLPDYMIPAYFIPLEKMPVTANGKIDRKSLPEPGETFIASGVAYSAPLTEIEKKLAVIWQQLLRLEKIGTQEDFFAMGGDSILVNRCLARIREELQVEIPLRKFFERPYIKALAGKIEKRERQVFAIKPAERQGEIPLSFAQQRLWFLQELDADNVAYFVPRVIRIKGPLEVSLIERSFTEIIRRHEIMRTVFPTIEGQPVQRIKPPFPFKIPVLDWINLEKGEQEQKVSEFLSAEARGRFDFEKGPLLRVTILKLKAEEHLFVLTEHHLIHDGWTQGVLLQEFIAIFTAYAAGKEHALPPLPIQYADFAIWQRKHLEGQILERHLAFWQENLAGLAPVLALPADRPRPPVISGMGELIIDRLSGVYTRRLREFSKKNGVTLFMSMLAVFKILLYRYTGVEDLCVGTGIANRKYKEMEGMLGMVINTLALRTQVLGEFSFKECLYRVKETCLGAYQHEDTPFVKVVEVVQPERSLSYSPLFQVMFSFMDTPGGALALPGLELELLTTHNRSAKFDISVVVVPPPDAAPGDDETGEILLEWEYNTDIFDAPTVHRVISHYNRILDEGLNRPDTILANLSLLSDTEMKQVLLEFNDTETAYPQGQTIHRLFAEQAAKAPDHIAIVGAGPRVCPIKDVEQVERVKHVGQVHLTYRLLNEQANRLAGLLIEKGVLADDLVGIMMARSIDLIIGLLGILKVGGAYLPIDPGYPQERIDYMLKDSRAAILLTDDEKKKPANCELSIVNCELLMSAPMAPFHHSSFIIHHSSHSSPLAYIIYTSGTTGRPKGVAISHKGFINLIYFHHHLFAVNEDSRQSQAANPAFDAMGLEVWPCLAGGAALHIVDNETRLASKLMYDWLIRRGITISFQSTAMVEQLLDESWPLRGVSLKSLCTGGDKLNRYPAQGLPFKLYNLYGPTEDTVCTTWALVEAEPGPVISPVIGKPVANHRVYILNSNLKCQPVGVPGELCIGGTGLAQGYLNNPELTAEKFGPQITQINKSFAGVIYKTGDLARWLADGSIEFKGRIDQQVKIRGFRIELGEIESRLRKHEMIKEAVVIVRENQTDKYLCAYIVPRDSGVPAPEAAELRNFLATALPAYMIPSFFMIIDKIPLTANGKINRRALPEPGCGAIPDQYSAPGDMIEEKLLEIWAEVLGLTKNSISCSANFFELGGHSLKATVMLAKIQKSFNVKPAMAEIFNSPTIQKLAEVIRKSKKTVPSDLKAIEKKEYYELSYNQKRLWIINRWDSQDASFNIPGVIPLNHEVDLPALKKTLQHLSKRHESFRTGFTIVANEPVQFVVKEIELPFVMKDISALPEKEKEPAGQQIYLEMASTPFELDHPPLFRTILVKRNPDHYQFMFNIHHIIADGWSMEILQREFSLLYDGYKRGEPVEPDPIEISYKDFAAWHNKQLDRLKQSQSFWEKKLSRGVPNLELPADITGIPADKKGASYQCPVTAELVEKLKTVAQQNNTSLFMIMFSLYILLISRFSGQEDISCSIIAAGRDQAALQNIIGFFVNSVIFTATVDENTPFSGLLSRTQADTMEIFQHQDYPLELLFDNLKIKYPRIPVSFNMVNFDFGLAAAGPGVIPSEPIHINNTRGAKFDLELYVKEYQNSIITEWSYRESMFQPAAIEYLGSEYLRLANYFTANPGKSYLDYKNTKKKRSLKRNEFVGTTGKEI
ncbi:MAG TPA: amino acid adenylation domain-containing protein [Candidatus Deferrimicrobium sp.]|nr:amino acid adenylation domain-containing protein [Candidatus Deferrimicrobium sp.]